MDLTPSSSFFRALSDPHTFTLTMELVPSRGGRGDSHIRALEVVRRAVADGRLAAVSITENAGGHVALSPEVLGTEIRQLGLEVIVHLSCKDKNRNQMESQLFAWDRLGIRDLLVITGDYPQPGYRGLAKPVFDLDSVQALDLIGRLNRGEGFAAAGPDAAGVRPEQATAFVRGVALSPFKHSEAELVMQYYKLHRKLAAGADFVITQVGYDARKFHEVLLYLRRHGFGRVPVLGNVFIPNLRVAELMYRGAIPGCVITPELYAQILREADSPDKGKQARLTRAAALLAVLKGLGYAGAHIGGPGLSYDDISSVLDQADTMAADWSALLPQISFWPKDSCHLFRRDQLTGLNLDEPAPSREPAGEMLRYRLAHLAHREGFVPGGLLYRPFKRACLAWSDSRLGWGLVHVEHLLKFIAFGCQNCGDCTLAELAYLCPQSACAKYLLNGPCGGSRDGWCEVYPGRRRCLYVRAYRRLKGVGRTGEMKEGLVPPRDWALNNSSSWVNYFRGIDHHRDKQAP
ncbi:MAG: methylenetetrahydrofolate reductase C-terminal domain-containing protein [Desulfurivibrio sp.]